jgi:hypothetical protein
VLGTGPPASLVTGVRRATAVKRVPLPRGACFLVSGVDPFAGQAGRPLQDPIVGEDLGSVRCVGVTVVISSPFGVAAT